MKERATFVNDIYSEGSFLFEEITSYDQTVIEKKWNDETTKIMGELIEEFKALSDFSASAIEIKIHSISRTQ
jgi:hypothetical protein